MLGQSFWDNKIIIFDYAIYSCGRLSKDMVAVSIEEHVWSPLKFLLQRELMHRETAID